MVTVRRPRTVWPITLGHGTNEFFSIAIPPIIPLLVTDLGITYAEAGFLLTVFFIMYSIFQLPAGIAADWLGKRRLMIAGLLGMSVAILLAAAAGGYGMLLVAQAIAGIGGSTFHPTGMSIISDVETGDTEGRAMGVFGLGGALGTLASPLVIGGLAAVAGWRAALAVAAALGLVVTGGMLVALRGSRGDGATAVRSDGGRKTVAARLSTLRERIHVPITRGIVILFCITLVLSLQHRAIHTFTTSYVVAETGTSVSFGNVVFFILLAGASVSSIWAGDLADRIPRTVLGGVTALGTAILVGLTLVLAHLLDGLGSTLLVATFSIWFFGIGLMMYAAYPVKNALISQQSEAAYSGSLFGVIQTASALGSATGPALFGVLSTQWGVVAAFPAIAIVGLVLAGLFGALHFAG